MTCTDTTTRFRLLDGNVGWDPDFSDIGGGGPDKIGTYKVKGLDDRYGLRIDDGVEPRLSNELISPFVPPAWLAPGCAPGEWFLAGFQSAAEHEEPILQRRDPCCPTWIDLRWQLASGGSLCHPCAVAARKRRLAALDRGGTVSDARLFIWSLPDGRLAGYVELDTLETEEEPRAIAFTPWAELIVATADLSESPSNRLLRFDLAGRAVGEILVQADGLRPDNPIRRLTAGRDGALYAAEGPPYGPFHLWQIRPAKTVACHAEPQLDVQRSTDIDYYHHAEENLDRDFRKTSLVSVDTDRFSIKEPVPDDAPAERCFATPASGRHKRSSDRNGQTSNGQSNGQLETLPIDSGIPRCRWHRVRVDAPPHTSFTLQVATAETKEGRPHENDWQPAVQSATDLLIDQPPGRYLFVRIRLQASETDGPLIRRVRIDFPRVTSLEQLPAVYRESPEAEDFTERFLSLFDATSEDLDRCIERFPALLDPEGVPEEVLPWLGTFLGILFDARWDADRRRQLLQAAPELYRLRGTVAGLAKTIELIFGDTSDTSDTGDRDEQPVIWERVWTRALGVLNQTARLGTMRIFGKSEARFRVGRSALGVAPLRSYGNPDHDPVRADAHRFTVLLPPDPNLKRIGTDQLERLIGTQKPAHTLHSWRVGGQGFILGRLSTIGIDTQLVPTTPPVLGSGEAGARCRGNVYLRRASILRPGPHRPTCTFRIGVNAGVGLNTSLE